MYLLSQKYSSFVVGNERLRLLRERARYTYFRVWNAVKEGWLEWAIATTEM